MARFNQIYERRFPTELLRRARDLFTGYLDETTRNRLIWQFWVTRTDGITVDLKNVDEFDLWSGRPMKSVALQAVGGFVPVFRLSCFGRGATEVLVDLPAEGDVENVVELFEQAPSPVAAEQAADVGPITVPSGGAAPASAREKSSDAEDRRVVFVIHGRNERIRRALFDFLRAIGLDPQEWREIVASTGEGSPYIGQALDAAFRKAQAVVVLMTGDDEGHLLPEFQQNGDPDHEKNLTPQPRLNVVFEAGMAMAWNASRTILVECGRSLRPFSDIVGRHTVRLDNTAERRYDLAARLRPARCAVNTDYRSDWLSTGDFS